MSRRLDWERVASAGTELLERFPVAGGWIYRNRYATIDHFSITFVPDPDALVVEPSVEGMIDSATHPSETPAKRTRAKAKVD